MRKLFLFAVLSGVFGFIAPGCAVSTGDEPAPEAQTFTRGSSGQAVPADDVSLESFTPAQTFDRSLASEGQQATSDIDLQATSCSGACNADVCVCTGDLACCIVGCDACWKVLDQT